MNTERAAAIILLVGSVLFIIAAFMPVSRVFVEPSPAAKLEIITSNRTAWTASQVLFGLGASIAAIGLASSPIICAARRELSGRTSAS